MNEKNLFKFKTRIRVFSNIQRSPTRDLLEMLLRDNHLQNESNLIGYWNSGRSIEEKKKGKGCGQEDNKGVRGGSQSHSCETGLGRERESRSLEHMGKMPPRQ